MWPNLKRYFLLLICAIGIFVIGGFIERTDTLALISIYFITFIAYLLVTKDKLSFTQILFFGIGLRLLLFAFEPTLSDDYYRFIWDGKMLFNGINPYAILPSEYIEVTNDNYLTFIYQNLNSPEYYSVYPPVNQLIYLTSALVNETFTSVFILRIFIITGEVITVIYLRKLLLHFNKNEGLASLYFLNPLIILELTGNLHFEGVMLAFLLMAIYYLLIHKYWLSIISFSLAVGVKLLPLMFFPVIILKLPNSWRFKYALGVFVLLILQFIPLINSEILFNFLSGINLYFQLFEFNASFFYLLRWLGYLIFDYNVIKTLGVLLGLVSLFSILILSWYQRKSEIFTALVYINALYLLLATTVHPWYLTMILAFSIFTKYRFVILWSFLIFLTYTTYSTETYNENLYLVFIEYTLIVGYIGYELYNLKKGIPAKG